MDIKYNIKYKEIKHKGEYSGPEWKVKDKVFFQPTPGWIIGVKLKHNKIKIT